MTVNVIPVQLGRNDAGALRAANPSESKVPPMRIIGSTVVSARLTNDDRVRKVEARVVKDSPYAFILAVEFDGVRKAAYASVRTEDVVPHHKHHGFPF